MEIRTAKNDYFAIAIASASSHLISNLLIWDIPEDKDVKDLIVLNNWAGRELVEAIAIA